MVSVKNNNIVIVFEAYGVLIVSHAIGGYYCAPLLSALLPQLPYISVAMLSTSAISAVITTIYLVLRTNFIPSLDIRWELLSYIVAGIIVAWFATFIGLMMMDRQVPLLQEVIQEKAAYYPLNFFLIILWGPFWEEVLFRGYFFELLRKQQSAAWALLFSTTLFVLFHGIWGGFSVGLSLIFLYSVIFTLLYMEGGLIVSVSVHAFVNFYLTVLNIGW